MKKTAQRRDRLNMEATPMVSVIVPIYNVEKYIRKCLDSIVYQTHYNLEIILIDDGSPDNCGMICDEYAKNDSRIRVIHKINGGVHAAWNDGLQMATGEWVAFVDSDDWLDVDYFEMMLNIQDAEIADVIQSAGYYWEESRGQSVRWAFLEPFSAKNGNELEKLKIKALLRSNDPDIKGSIGYIWGKLYRKRFLKEGAFHFDASIRTGMMGDTLFNLDVFEKAAVVLGIRYCGYHYRILQNSGTFKFNPNRAKAQEYVEEQFYLRCCKEGSSDELFKAVESRCLRDIVHNLQYCYFHPENPASYREIVKGIREMKQMPYYKAAIHSKKNPYNNLKLKALQFALYLPWVWPLRIIVFAWNMLDKVT